MPRARAPRSAAPSWAAAQRATAAARARTGGRSAPWTARRSERGAEPARREPHADAGPVDARGVLVHVAGGRADDDRAAGGERAHERAVAAVADDDVAQRHRLRVGEPGDEHARWPAPAIGAVGLAAVPGGDHAHRARRRGPRAPRAAAGARGPARSRARPARPGRRPAAARRARPAAPTAAARRRAPSAGQRARVLELRAASPTSVSSRESPVWTHGERRQPEPAARLVELRRGPARARRSTKRRFGARPQRRARARVRGSRAPIE